MHLEQDGSVRASDGVNLTGDDGAVLNSGSVVASDHTVDREVLVKERKNLLSTGGVAPVTHEIADNGEERDELDTSLLHARVGSVTDELRVGAGGLDVGEDGVALGAEGEGKEGSADVGGDAGNDDLLLAGGLDGGLEFRVVPGAGGMSVDYFC